MIAKEIIVFMRFSMLGTENSWKLAKAHAVGSYEDYKSRLFAEDRLKFRLWTLEKLALRSLFINIREIGEDGPKVTFILMTSDELPNWARSELNRILAKVGGHLVSCGVSPHYPKEIVQAETQRILQSRGTDTIFATTNLDDDDILADTALRRIGKYLNKAFIGHSVTLANGLMGHFDQNTNSFVRFCELYLPMSSVGISYINKYNWENETFSEKRYVTVIGLGGHLHIDARVPLIIDARRPGWIRTMHADNDVKVGVSDHWSTSLPKTHESYIRHCIDLDAYPIADACRRELQRGRPRNIKHSKKTREFVQNRRLKERIRSLVPSEGDLEAPD